MKLKLNLDKDAIREFFVQNVEKIVFGGFVVCFVLIIFGARGQGSFDQTPDDLLNTAAGAETEIKKEKTPAEGFQSPDYVAIVDRMKQPIKEESYGHAVPWKPALFKERLKRGVPPLYTVEKLRGVAGVGPFDMRRDEAAVAAASLAEDGSGPRSGTSSPGGSVTRGQRWVALTGLVPNQKQRKAYADYFQNRQKYNPQTDVPEYIYYRVERAEVRDRDPTGQLQWTPLHLRNALAIPKQWSGEVQGLIDERYIDKKLVFPLGPLKGRQWTAEEVAYPPEIPLDSPQQGWSPRDTPDPQEPETTSGTGPDVPDDVPVTRDVTGTPEDVPPRPGLLPGNVEPEYKLFRFFDYTVEPGRKYRYRVRLMLGNPSLAMDRQFLEENVDSRFLERPKPGGTIDLSTSRWLETLPSETTDVIEVPRETELLALKVSPPLRASGEPTCVLKVIKFVSKYGIVAETQVTVSRGKVINLPGRQYPETKETKKKDESETLPDFGRVEGTQAVPVDYITDALALDIRGGERLPGKVRLNEPGELLLLDPDGSLVVHNVLDDLSEDRRRLQTGQQTGEGLPGADLDDGVTGTGQQYGDADNLDLLNEVTPKRPRKSGRR